MNEFENLQNGPAKPGLARPSWLGMNRPRQAWPGMARPGLARIEIWPVQATAGLARLGLASPGQLNCDSFIEKTQRKQTTKAETNNKQQKQTTKTNNENETKSNGQKIYHV